MRPVIGVPDLPGLNGVEDTIAALRAHDMKPERLYFHFHDPKRLEENARMLMQMDGAVLSGGFPYEDRLGFGRVGARIDPLREAVRHLVDTGRPVLAYCAGFQMAAEMGLLFQEGSQHRISLKPNIADAGGEIMWSGFRDQIVHVRLEQPPERNAFTRSWGRDEVFKGIIDHGGGRVSADDDTLRHLLENGMVLLRYVDKNGIASNEWPVNPNGSDLNIESLTNRRGNLKIGMVHHERRLNALYTDTSTGAFVSMREYIEDRCLDLSSYAIPQTGLIPLRRKDYSYLHQTHDPGTTIDIYVQMLTDDNERNTALLFLNGMDLQRRRILRVSVAPEYATQEGARAVLKAIAKRDLFDGIMLKKDLPTITGERILTERYEIVDKTTNERAYKPQDELVDGYPISTTSFPELDPHAYELTRALRRDPELAGMITGISIGTGWFFHDKGDADRAMRDVLG